VLWVFSGTTTMNRRWTRARMQGRLFSHIRDKKRLSYQRELFRLTLSNLDFASGHPTEMTRLVMGSFWRVTSASY
jgi:hypothetical protein